MIRAYVTDDPRSFGVAVSLVNQDDSGSYPREIFRLAGNTQHGQEFTIEEVKPGAFTEPTLILPDYMARELLDGLARHYSGAEDTRALRRDYDAERARVDKLTAALTDLAGKVADRIPEREAAKP